MARHAPKCLQKVAVDIRDLEVVCFSGGENRLSSPIWVTGADWNEVGSGRKLWLGDRRFLGTGLAARGRGALRIDWQ